jgi:hypothetical protein
MNEIEIKKNGKGHDVIINGNLAFWIIGSKRNAEKELKNYLNN